MYLFHGISVWIFVLDKFDRSTEESIGFYVYCLVDPRDKKPFYIGKGQRSRVFEHSKGVTANPVPSDKLDIINEM